MSHEIERERESTRPERENPALPVPAIRGADVARSPHACDPTAGGRDGLATSCLVHSMYPPAVQGGLAPSSAQCAPADDRPHARERSCGLAQDRSDGEGREWPSPSDQSTAKPHMARPVEVEHPQCAPGLAGDVGESSPCPGDDYSHPRGLARGTKNGGNPSAVGHTYAFGNTLEKLSLRVFGVKQRGSKEDPPMSHATGIGYVAKRDGDYSDAIVNKKLKVHMLLMETLGGISPGGVSYLGKLAGLADPAARGSRDSTAYVCWSAPTFMAHHGMRVSAALVHANALLLAEGARRLKISKAAT